ncbi:MAG: RNA 2',3'-cyclic phosphodiesterase [Gemmatimonadetes bacterium]|nr:RNA 2',3'-cyclic phosphodiesterase [Gemmatimonadota bacterium]
MRLFIAIDPGKQVATEVWSAVEKLRDKDYPIRWVSPQGIHLTLKFLGEVDAGRENEIAGTLDLAVARTHAFDLCIDGFGAFPTSFRPKAVWAGCEASDALKELHENIEARMSKLGFSPDDRPFSPHMTLGRVRRGGRVRNLAGDFEELSGFRSNSKITSVELMRSELSSSGAKYSTVHSARLPT